MGAVELLAQGAVAAVLEEGGVAGHVQAQQPGAALGAGLGAIGALEVGGAGRLGQLVGEAGRQALGLGRINQGQGPAVGGIKHLVAEAGGEFGQLLAGPVEGGLHLPLQAHAAQLHVPQFRRQDPLLGAIEPSRGPGMGGLVLALEGLQGPENRLALAGPAAEFHHRRLLAGMGEAQLRAVADAVEVANHAPAPAQLLA